MIFSISTLSAETVQYNNFSYDELLAPALDDNNPDALYCLAYKYLAGEETRQDISKALYLYNQAALQIDTNSRGMVLANHSLGMIYFNGGIVSKDMERAYEYFKVAAKYGYLDSIFHMGIFHFEGLGSIQKDEKVGLAFFEEAGKNGHAESLWNLGRLHYIIKSPYHDFAKAMDYFMKASEHGHLFASQTVGNMYINGEGVEEDPIKAMEYFRLAANGGDMVSQYQLGRLLLKYGGDNDIREGLQWLQEAAKQDDVQSQFLLGSILCIDEVFGKDMSEYKDLSQAAIWLKKAKDKGHQKAAEIWNRHELSKYIN